MKKIGGYLMESTVLYLIPALGLLGLVVMAVKSSWVSKQSSGDDKIVELSTYIAEGAMAFLKAEWKVLGYFSVVAAALLAWSGTMVETSSPVIAISLFTGIPVIDEIIDVTIAIPAEGPSFGVAHSGT